MLNLRRVMPLSPFVFPGRTNIGRFFLILAVSFVLVIGTLLPHVVHACGWWGEAGSETRDAAIIVDGKGNTRKETQNDDDSPQALTRQGNHLRRFGASGYAGAFRLYRQAALAGYAPAQNNLAAMYEEGRGVAVDLAEAAQWYQRAAQLGEPHAQHSIGEMLLNGRGVERNPREGIRWIEKAALQDHASACAGLGRMYSTGQYLRRDIGKATYWWKQAERLGYPVAKNELEALKELQGASGGSR